MEKCNHSQQSMPPPHLPLSLSKTDFSLSRCTSPHPPAVLVHECSVHSPPGVSAERKPDSQHCLPLKTPAAAFLPRGSAGTRGVVGGAAPPTGSDLQPADTAPEESRAPGGTRTSNYAAEPRGRMEKRLWRERAAPLSKRSMDGAAGKKWLQFINPKITLFTPPDLVSMMGPKEGKLAVWRLAERRRQSVAAWSPSMCLLCPVDL